MKLRRFQFSIAACLCLGGIAQGPIQPVQWTATVTPKTAINPGARIVVELSAKVQEGWHVYGLTQLPGGPMPLRVKLDTNDVVEVAGAPTGSPPIKKHDAAFDLDTEVYEGPFDLHLPVKINQHSAGGGRLISVSVHFQACNDRVCLPPRTAHFSTPIEISQSN